MGKLIEKAISECLQYCYDSITLELIKKRNLVLELTQENLIENSVQDCLPYILKPIVNATLLLAYSKQPCVCLKVNMYLTCYMTSFFQNLLYSSIVICDHVTDV